MQVLTQLVDSSFKYILLAFNFITLLVVYIHKKRNKINKEHHILFVIAHPDDQAMFFGPTLNSLTSQYFIHLLCLSNGNTIRAQQLADSAKYFGVHKYECIHDENMIDGMKQKWCQATIIEKVKNYVEANNIKAIFTFDEKGVSDHINHRTIHYALSKLQVQDKAGQKKSESRQQTQGNEKPKENAQLNGPLLTQKKQQSGSSAEIKEVQIQKKPIKIYYLQTTNILRKYSGLLQLLIVPFKQFSWVRLNYFYGYNSMALHKSQFVWYRKLFVLFSRYTYINTYRMKKILFP